MNKYLWILVSALAFSSARSEAPLPPPKPPLLARLPAYASWVEKIATPSEEPQAENMDGGSTPTKRTLKEVKVIKGPRNRQITKKWSDGLTTEIWVCGDIVLQEEPGLKSIYISTAASRSASPMSFGANHSNADFPDLEWISPSNYVGTKPYQGKVCYVFQTKDTSAELKKSEALAASLPRAESSANSSESQSPAPTLQISKTAWIDPETRLPVALNDGIYLRTYTFLDPPSHDPQPPQRFIKAWEKYEAAARGPIPINR